MLQIYKYNINIIVYFDNLTLNILFFFNSQEIKNYFPKSFYKIYKAHEPCAPTIFSYPYGSSANRLTDLKNPYGSSANRLDGQKIRMATQQTTWRAQKSVWQLSKPLGEPKNPYGNSANRLDGPKIRMATQQTTWRAQKSVWLLSQPLGGPEKSIKQFWRQIVG